MATVATWYHAEVRGVSRGDRKSAVGLASYITGKKLYDEENQRGCYRGHPGDVLAWGTIAPPNAPPYLTDPEQLAKAWNDAQRAETRINSHLANHWDIGLWRKATPEQNRAVMQRIAERTSEKYGVMVTWAVHAPSGEGSEHNLHGHLAMNMRRVTSTGFGAKAREIVDGKTRSLETEWMRRMIAEEINTFLASVNAEERVSHQSYRQRGMLKEPMIHMGANAWQAEKRGEPTALGNRNREIRARNQTNEADDRAHDGHIAKAHREADILNFNAQRLTAIASGKAPMELTPGQADQRAGTLASGYEQMQAQYNQANEYIDQQKLLLEQFAKRRAEEEKEPWKRRGDPDIADPYLRWSNAINKPLGDRDSFSLMAAAARSECSEFKASQEDYRQQEAREADPQKRQILQLRRHVEAADYMAITSERMIGVSKFLGGPRNGRAPSESEEYYRDEAAKYREIGTKERGLLKKVRENTDAKTMDQFQREVMALERRAREPIGRTGRIQQENLTADMPNRDRPQNDQTPPLNYTPTPDHTAPENLFERDARDQEGRRSARREVTNARTEFVPPEISDEKAAKIDAKSEKFNEADREREEVQDQMQKYGGREGR